MTAEGRRLTGPRREARRPTAGVMCASVRGRRNVYTADGRWIRDLSLSRASTGEPRRPGSAFRRSEQCVGGVGGARCYWDGRELHGVRVWRGLRVLTKTGVVCAASRASRGPTLEMCPPVPPSLTGLCQHVNMVSPRVTEVSRRVTTVSPRCHTVSRPCHGVSQWCHRGRSHGVTEVSHGVTACHACHGGVTACHGVTSVSRCHGGVNMVSPVSPRCHEVSHASVTAVSHGVTAVSRRVTVCHAGVTSMSHDVTAVSQGVAECREV